MPRLREVPRSEVHPFGEVMYGLIFGDRDPVPKKHTVRHRQGIAGYPDDALDEH